MGLPGAGKTTFARKLKKYIGNAAHYNADEVRKVFDDFDFSPEGRERQAKRMRYLCDKSNRKGMHAIAEFVCPLEVYRKDIVKADMTVWMDTIASGRYEDTNKLFERPTQKEIKYSSMVVVKDYSYDIILEKLKERIEGDIDA